MSSSCRQEGERSVIDEDSRQPASLDRDGHSPLPLLGVVLVEGERT